MSAATPQGDVAANNDIDIKILCLEIIRKDEYTKWKNDPRFVGEALLKTRAAGDILKELVHRFDISHLNENFVAWNTAVLSVTDFYSSDEVRAMTNAQANSSSFKFEYELDDLVWECEFSVKAFQARSGALRKTLVIHLPNDGYFYLNGVEMEKYLGEVDKKNVVNKRHRNTCYDGWQKLNKQVWEKLGPFKTFMLNWFGSDVDESRVERTILYHSDANRVDLCMRHMDENIAIEFSFEHSYPIGLDEDNWDTF